VLPSYSLAKSLYVGLGFMRLEKLWPGSSREAVADHVPACTRDGNWDDVSLHHLVDMATGNYESSEYDADETSPQFYQFQAAQLHAEKIALACDHFPRQARPGTRWVYHTTDSYIASTVFDHYLANRWGRRGDFFTDILIRDIWQPLSLSPTSYHTLRTQDAVAQPFAGNGLSFHADDIAKLSHFLNAGGGRVEGTMLFDEVEFDAAMQRNPADTGLVTSLGSFRYNNGFWGVTTSLCEAKIAYPFMSGYGGITVAFFPNGTSYYVFSDNQQFDWRAPAVEAHKIRSFCGQH
jgi:hypothetical protein